jgi:uncharacterized protein (TIGR02001 family)
MTSTMTYRIITASTLLAYGVLALHAPACAADDKMALTANVNLVSQYRFRGIDQTWGKPAVQGGADLTTPAGLYVGLWASNVSGNSYPGGSLELDYYGGYNGKISDDWGYTVGGYGYWYPGANYDKAACPSAAFASPCALPSQSLNTFELNAGVSWKWLSYKLSVSTGDYFGANTSTGYSKGTRGTLYHDVTVTWPIADDLSLVAHLGHTDVRASLGSLNPDYSDYRVALAKTFNGGWNVSAAVVGAGNNAFFRPPAGGLSLANGDTRDLNKPVLVLQAGRSF